MRAPDAVMAVSNVEQHRELLRRLIAARIGGSFVDDVMQEVALAIEKSSAVPTDPGEFRNWVCGVAIRQCALVLRQEERRRRVITGANERLAAGRAEEVDDPIYWLLAQETRQQLRRAIGGMEATSRQLLTMRFVLGATYREIAQELGLTVRVAEHRVQAAKQELKRLLLERGLGEEDL